jgi:hypothetical protein
MRHIRGRACAHPAWSDPDAEFATADCHIAEAERRMREKGHIFLAKAFVVRHPGTMTSWAKSSERLRRRRRRTGACTSWW